MTDGIYDDEGPEQGHRFRFSVESAGSYSVSICECTHDYASHEHAGPGWCIKCECKSFVQVKSPRWDADFMGDPWTLTVRAWNLSDALRIAAAAPLTAWDMGEVGDFTDD